MNFIAHKNTAGCGFAITFYTFGPNIVSIRFIRQAQNDLCTANRTVPACPGFEDVFENIIRIVTKAIYIVDNFNSDILIRRKGHIENRPWNFITF